MRCDQVMIFKLQLVHLKIMWTEYLELERVVRSSGSGKGDPDPAIQRTQRFLEELHARRDPIGKKMW